MILKTQMPQMSSQSSQSFTQTIQDLRDSSEAIDKKDSRALKKKKRMKSAAVSLCEKKEQKVMEWLKDVAHDLFYNKNCANYKDRPRRRGLAGAVTAHRCPCKAAEAVVLYAEDSLWEVGPHQVWTEQR